VPALVIESLPEPLHSRLKQAAAAHRRSLAQETIVLLEQALEQEPIREEKHKPSYWAERTLLPEYDALLKSGALSGGTDSTQMISEERNAR
jgi:plasmid stability protein